MLAIKRYMFCGKCEANTIHKVLIVEKGFIFSVFGSCDYCGNTRHLDISPDDYIVLIRRQENEAPSAESII